MNPLAGIEVVQILLQKSKDINKQPICSFTTSILLKIGAIKVFVWGMCVWVCLVDLRWSGINDLVTKLMLHFLVRRSWLWPDLVTALDSVGADGLRATSGSKYWPKQILLMSCFKIECQNSTIDLHFSSWHCLNPLLLSLKSRRQRQDPGQTRHAGMQISN